MSAGMFAKFGNINIFIWHLWSFTIDTELSTAGPQTLQGTGITYKFMILLYKYTLMN